MASVPPTEKVFFGQRCHQNACGSDLIVGQTRVLQFPLEWGIICVFADGMDLAVDAWVVQPRYVQANPDDSGARVQR